MSSLGVKLGLVLLISGTAHAVNPDCTETLRIPVADFGGIDRVVLTSRADFFSSTKTIQGVQQAVEAEFAGLCPGAFIVSIYDLAGNAATRYVRVGRPAAIEEPKEDPAPYEFLGFSPDGRYLSFSYSDSASQSGIWDSKMRFVDVQRNAFAVKGLDARDKDKSVALKQVRGDGAEVLRRLEITPGKHGELVYSHPAVVGWNTRATQESILNAPGKVVIGGSEISVESINGLKAVHCDNPDGDYQFLGVRVSVKNLKSGATKTLQEDSARIPPGRGCPIRYAIKSIYRYKQSLAVNIFVLSPGFEGFPRVDYLTVAGTTP